MSNYTQITDFSVKDALTTGDPEKLILGSDFDAEFAAIATAIASKLDGVNIATQAEAEAMLSNAVLMTPLAVSYILDDNAGVLGDLQNLNDPGVDRLLGWDDSVGTAGFFGIGTGLTIDGTNLLTIVNSGIDHDALTNFIANEHVNHSSVSVIAGDGLTGGGTIAANRTLNVVAGDGLVVTADAVAVDPTIAGVGLSWTAGVLAMDISEFSSITAATYTPGQDGILMSDNGVPGVMPLNEAGIKTVDVSDAAQTFAEADLITIQRLTNVSANRTWTIPTNLGVNGSFIIVNHGSFGSAFTLTVQGAATVELRSRLRSGAAAAGAHTILAGGTAVIYRLSSTVWNIEGAIA